MFSVPITNATKAMRPGLIAGCRPERSDPAPGWFDRFANGLKGRMLQFVVDRQGGLRKFAASVGRLGETFKGLDDSQLDHQLIHLRRQFRSEGLQQPLCARAMALIREVSSRTLGLRPYDTQVMAGWVMLQGQLAEMETGEGKTLAATLPAATAALAGVPVHVITVNEYLVERDARLMGPLYRALGLTVGFVAQSMSPEDRRAAYACDITYGTNHQLAFDYLRDQLHLGHQRSLLRMQLQSADSKAPLSSQLLLRGLCYAVVDEADSVLIDEARTPLIITRNVDSTDEHHAYRRALDMALQLKAGSDFYFEDGRNHLKLSRAGQQRLACMRSQGMGVWGNARQREVLIGQALHALHLLKKDRDYLVKEDKVVIIDANTGRPMPDRSWERGLHQMVEAKEGCPLTDTRQQLGRITYQRFFRRYMRLGGMSGTAREVGNEIWSVYGLRVKRIPLHRPSRRQAGPSRIYAHMEDKWAEVVHAVKACIQKGRPVLIGTGSVSESDGLSRILTAAGIRHQVLNARQDEDEAKIVGNAGRSGCVTVATNMAGRGTDIPLGEGVSDLGGLHVIAVCRNEARRIDRQLFGRCARHGDPGSYEVVLSLEDELIQNNCRPLMVRYLVRRTLNGRFLKDRLNHYFFRRAQRKVELRHRAARRALLCQDRHNDRMLAFSGNME